MLKKCIYNYIIYIYKYIYNYIYIYIYIFIYIYATTCQKTVSTFFLSSFIA